MGEVNPGNVAGAAASGASVGAVAGPWGAGIGALVGGGIELFRELMGRDPTDDEIKQAEAAQYAGGQGSPLTNHLAALDYSEGLTQQQSQNAREAGFYSQAQGNFDVANAAQLRDAPQIEKSLLDEQRQTDALTQTRHAGNQISSTGDQLTRLGTRPMGDSYAEAQLRQGQQAAMAQQLSMARSGRSLGSGQASMANAAFNNAALNQQTNQAAAAARIQEQNAYNQFQANALGQAGNQYAGAGTLAGQAGNQATTIRQGNEGLQKTNADLTQNQQTVNNQTTGLYNNLGAQQQGLGMDANRLGTNAFQFGAQQGANKQQAQLNANVGQTTSTTAVNLAQAEADRAREAARLNMATTAIGAGAEAVNEWGKDGSSSGGSVPTNPNDAYKNITTSSHATPGTPNQGSNPGSDEKNKTGITPLEPPKKGEPGYAAWANEQAKYRGMTPEQEAAYRAADAKAKSDREAGIVPTGRLMDDQDLGKIAVTGEAGSYMGPRVASYGETIHALNEAYRPSQFAPADILNHVPGAGSGHSKSQNDVIERMRGVPQAIAPRTPAPTVGVMKSPQALARAAAAAAAPPAAPPPAWGDVFKQPKLSSPVDLYLRGLDPYVAPAPTGQMHYEGAPREAPERNPNDQSYRGNEQNIEKNTATSDNGARSGSSTQRNPNTSTNDSGRRLSGIELKKDIVPIGSDDRSKDQIRDLEGQLAALRGGRSPAPSPRAPDYAALDDAYARQQRPEGVDFRNAHGYSFEYKNPKQQGAAPGRQVGTMAQELELTDGAPYVHDTPQGKTVDTSRLPLALAPAIGHTQRRVDDLERELSALKGSGFAPHRPELYPSPRAAY